MSIENFLRFQDGDDNVLYGEIPSSETSGVLEGKTVTVLSGDPFTGFSKTKSQATIKKVLCPLESTPIFMCIGLNYAHHAKEANLTIPTYPVTFTKPADALAGPYSTIPIHPLAQPQLDYEGELCIIIAKDCKNITADQALNYVLGYTSGNDLSARNLQLPASVSGSQFSYAKSFDGFAPIGPTVLLSHPGIDPQKFSLVTRVNGEERQRTSTEDMIWSVKQIIEHLSRGTTLRRGTVVMTGTPSGVGLFMEPKGFLRDGDFVEVVVEGVGGLGNVVSFERE